MRMLVRLHRLRERGWPIPKYQFAFKPPTLGELTLFEVKDDLLNRHTRMAKLTAISGRRELLAPPLLDAQLVELSQERMVFSGIERQEDILLSKIEDFAQTWVCWLRDDDEPG